MTEDVPSWSTQTADNMLCIYSVRVRQKQIIGLRTEQYDEQLTETREEKCFCKLHMRWFQVLFCQNTARLPHNAARVGK